MNIEIITEGLELEIHGFSGIALNGDYGGTAFKLMDRMWKVVKSDILSNEGKNIWIYEHGNSVFAGVRLFEAPKPASILEHKRLHLAKYAYFKHIGPYGLIKQVGQSMNRELESQGFEVQLPYIEIYGHWTNDESKLETELFMSLK